MGNLRKINLAGHIRDRELNKMAGLSRLDSVSADNSRRCHRLLFLGLRSLWYRMAGTPAVDFPRSTLYMIEQHQLLGVQPIR